MTANLTRIRLQSGAPVAESAHAPTALTSPRSSILACLQETGSRRLSRFCLSDLLPIAPDIQTSIGIMQVSTRAKVASSALISRLIQVLNSARSSHQARRIIRVGCKFNSSPYGFGFGFIFSCFFKFNSNEFFKT